LNLALYCSVICFVLTFLITVSFFLLAYNILTYEEFTKTFMQLG